MKLGLRARIISILLVTALAPTLFLGTLAIRSAERDVKSEVIRGNLALVRSIGRQLDKEIQSARRSLVIAANAWGCTKENTQTLNLLLPQLYSELPLLRRVSAFSLEGEYVGGAKLHKRYAIDFDAANSYGGYVSDVFVDGAHRQVFVVVQARDHRGALFGYLAGLIDLAFVSDRLNEAKVGKNAALLIVDGYGKEVAKSGALPLFADKELKITQNPAIDRVLAKHNEDHLEFFDSEHRRWLATYRNIASMSNFRSIRWGVILMQPTRSAYALAAKTKEHTVWVAVIVFVVVTLIGFLLAGRLISPLNTLVRQSERIADGDLAIQLLPIKGHDELARLTQSFSSMVHNLKSSRSKLFALKEFQENLVKSLPIGVISINRDKRIVSINQAQLNLSQIEEDEALDKIISDTFDKTYDDRHVFEEIDRVLQSGKSIDLSIEDKKTPFTGNYKALKYRISITPLRNRQNEVDGAVILQEDLSRAAKLEQQLIHSEKLTSVGVLAAGVAHEINNPLTTILGYAKFLSEDLAVDDPKRPTFELIADEATRVQHIIRGLLDFSRPEQASVQPEDPNELIERTLRLVHPELKKRTIELKKELDKELSFIEANGRRIEQVLVNIITNAAHAMEDSSQRMLTIHSHSQIEGDEHFIRIDIEDTGKGISSEEQKNIFDPFFTTKDPGIGTGLGLAVSHGIIQEHGGRIEVSSEKNKGTVFSLFLPAMNRTQND